ncbi:MAG: ribosome biogenesis protein [Euryarchaeota archaeon RBG_16_62_10]|nr:MAG: ribosome biogenesis protein [Euryarchaeota archaeon RBG_16_62_10]
MKTLLRKCPLCKAYTLQAQCPKCGGTTLMPMPAKYSPDDRYGEYRRRLKREMAGEA